MTAQQKAKKLTARREAADKLTSAERLRALAEESHGLARIVAKNPSTLISLLRDLSRSEDEATRKSVISNPRAPYDVLSNLELQFSELSVNNPALQFYNSLKPQFVGITLHIVGVCINRIGTETTSNAVYLWPYRLSRHLSSSLAGYLLSELGTMGYCWRGVCSLSGAQRRNRA